MFTFTQIKDKLKVDLNRDCWIKLGDSFMSIHKVLEIAFLYFCNFRNSYQIEFKKKNCWRITVKQQPIHMKLIKNL